MAATGAVAARATWEFSVLGPLEVRCDGEPVGLGGQRQRALLALLLLNANRVVGTEQLVDRLWGEHPPPTATASLQNGIGHLRKALGADRVETRPPGYRIRVDGDELDLTSFERVLHDARSLPPEVRATALRDSLARWRGPPLADFTYEAFAQSEIARLEELRLTALEERIDADLELGRDAELVGELESLIAAHPLRERLRGQLMLALYRSGRQAEALEAYRVARHALTEELGIEPTPTLQRLNASILRQDAALDASGAPPATIGDEVEEAARALVAGRVVLVVGPGVATDGAPVRPAAVAARLAESFRCPPAEGCELPRVAQYVAVTRGIGPLYDELHDFFSEDAGATPVQAAVADLAVRLRELGSPAPVVVTTGYDHAFEQALEERDQPFDTLAYVAGGRDRGRFVHLRADGDACLVELPNAYVDVPIGERVVLVKVYGQVDLDPGRDRESFVVSEDDYIAYLAQTEVTNVLPVTVAAKLRRSHLLFLGYGLGDWTLRVFLQRVWPDERPSYRSWAVEPDVDPLERDSWRHRGVDLVESELEPYLERLIALLRDAPAAGAVP